MKPKMMVITNVDYFMTDKDVHEIIRTNPWRYPLTEVWGNGEAPVMDTAEIVKEIIRGRRFVDARRGIDIYVGATENVQDILGLQYNLYDRIKMERDSAEESLSKLRTEKEKVQSRKWWDMFYEMTDIRWQTLDKKIELECEKAKINPKNHARASCLREIMPGPIVWINTLDRGSWVKEMYEQSHEKPFLSSVHLFDQ